VKLRLPLPENLLGSRSCRCQPRRRNQPFIERQSARKERKVAFVKLIMLYKSPPRSLPSRISVALEPSLPDLSASTTTLPSGGCKLPPRSAGRREGQMGTFFGSVPATQQYIWTLPWHTSAIMQHQSCGKCPRFFSVWLKKAGAISHCLRCAVSYPKTSSADEF